MTRRCPSCGSENIETILTTRFPLNEQRPLAIRVPTFSDEDDAKCRDCGREGTVKLFPNRLSVAQMEARDALQLLGSLKAPLHPLTREERMAWAGRECEDAMLGEFADTDWGEGVVIVDGDTFHVQIIDPECTILRDSDCKTFRLENL